MYNPSTFQVYNASAGSGKTFTLVKEYLKILLTSSDIFTFQKILAITFTNKAAGEMKERVLSNLEDFANDVENDLLPVILQEITMDKTTIKDRSQKILEAILQNYAAFSITTIDSFTHKIIKNFAYDLGLSLNFEVELDSASLLNEAVEVLISKIGTDKELTKLLINYSLDKIDDDKSWDISKDLNEFARVLLSEDDIPYFKKLANNTIKDFINLKKRLQQNKAEIEKEFADFGTKVLDFIYQNGLEENDFTYRGEYPKHFVKFQNLKNIKVGDIKFEGRLNTFIVDDKNLYSAKTPADAKATIDEIKPQLHQFYYDSQQLFNNKYPKYLFSKMALKSIIPLAVLNNINAELHFIKEENNIQLNTEFNQLISENIKEQPAPFIYERIGQRFHHYFIDEMQDTSTLQWRNLLPLIDNSLAQEDGKLLLVGDGKQAIYRWRGGKAEQFIELGDERKKSPFLIEKIVSDLRTNFRSFSKVIDFNNQFFQHASQFLSDAAYQQLFFDGNQQEFNSKKGGYVAIDFLEEEQDKELKKIQYPRKVLEKVLELTEQFHLNEICVLVRKRKDGLAVANYLSDHGISIISSETLLLQNSTKVQFIINVLQLIQNPSDEEVLFEILYFLHNHLNVDVAKHQFCKEYSKSNFKEITASLKNYGVNFDVANFHLLPFYEKVEAIIRGFKLIHTSDAYVQFFLDVVLEQQRKVTDIAEFLDFWELKKNVLSIVAPESADAVKIMTIHKSKGLEFPVVIFPYDEDMYHEINPKFWMDNPIENDDNFQDLYANYSRSVRFAGDKGEVIFNQRNSVLELDSFNLLYVTLTRAVEQLHIIKERKINSKGEEDIKFYAGIFINFLKQKGIWKDDVLQYSFSDKTRASKKEPVKVLSETHERFVSTPWKEHNLELLASSSKLWDTDQKKAIDYGVLFHEILAKIYTKDDAKKIVKQYHQQGILDDALYSKIDGIVQKIMNHPKLTHYFTDESLIYNEREIVDVDNQTIIPDRLVFNNNKVTIIDYKTGVQKSEHHQQVLKYARVLKSMDFIIDKKLLIYINDEIDVVEV